MFDQKTTKKKKKKRGKQPKLTEEKSKVHLN